MTTSQEIRDRLDELDQAHAAARNMRIFDGDLVNRAREQARYEIVRDLPKLTAAVRAMANLADVLDELDDPSRVAAHLIRRHLADALTAEEERQ